MAYTEEEIKRVIDTEISKKSAPIVRHYDGYIILAQDERDYSGKIRCIQRGDIVGFRTIEGALREK